MDNIHAKIVRVIQEVWDEEKVKINGVNIDWLDLTTGSGYKYLVRQIDLNSETRHLIED